MTMCLAVPMQITSIDGSEARCAARGIERQVSLFMLPEGTVSVGSWVLVHVGYALQVVSEAEARETWDLFDQVTEAEEAVA
jgi:hydrogenase expression/formation protein HypC